MSVRNSTGFVLSNLLWLGQPRSTAAHNDLGNTPLTPPPRQGGRGCKWMRAGNPPVLLPAAGESAGRLAHLTLEDAGKVVRVGKTGAPGGFLDATSLHCQPFGGLGDFFADQVTVGRRIAMRPEQPAEISFVNSCGTRDVPQIPQFQMTLINQITAVLKRLGRAPSVRNAWRLGAFCFPD
jgi:hypothetical protein